VAMLIGSFGGHTPVQGLRLGISLTMVGSLSREAISVSMWVRMVGSQLMAMIITKHTGGLQTYACSHGNANQGKLSGPLSDAGTDSQHGQSKTGSMVTVLTSIPRLVGS